MVDTKQLGITKQYFKDLAISTLAFQLNRHNAPGEYYSRDAEDIVDAIMKAVDCAIAVAIEENKGD